MEFATLGAAVLKMVAPPVAKALLTQVKSRLNPTELEAALTKGMQAADSEHESGLDPSKMLFRRCPDKPKRDFLEAALKHPSALGELQKPLEAQGLPDVACLVKVFSQVKTDQHVDLNDAILEPWIKTFTHAYVQETSAYIALRVAQDDYLEQLANWFDDVKFAGVAIDGQEVDRANQLLQIFVMPDVQEEVTRTGFAYVIAQDSAPDRQVVLLAEQRYYSNLERTGRKLSARQLLQQPNRTKAAVLLGAPGSGKTTLLSYFAIALAMQAKTLAMLADPLPMPGGTQAMSGNPLPMSGNPLPMSADPLPMSADPLPMSGGTQAMWDNALARSSDVKGLQPHTEELPLPILVRIRDWARFPNLSLLEYARHFAEKTMEVKKLPVGFFEYWLERGKALILLDGLDEVAEDAKRYDLVQRIENFLGQHRENFAIITSRPAGYKRDFFRTHEYPHYELLMFDDPKMEEFINHWYDSRIPDKAEAERKKESLRKALGDNDRIKLLARNPLLLTIIALIHRYYAVLPKERHKIYKKSVETLLISWDALKELTNHTVFKYLDLDDVQRLMEQLAYWIHTQGSTSDPEGGTLIDKDELLEQLTRLIKARKPIQLDQARNESKRFLQLIRERTGLLNEQGQDCYAFVHKTLQEYLCAQDIMYRADDEDDFDIVLSYIKDYLHNPHWREVLLLLVAQQKPKKAAKAIRAILKNGSEYEQWLHRDLMFAGICLLEDPKGLQATAQDLIAEVLSRLVQLSMKDDRSTGREAKKLVEEIIFNLSETSFAADALEHIRAYRDRISHSYLVKSQMLLGNHEEALESLLILLEDRLSSQWALEMLGKSNKFVEASKFYVQRLISIFNGEASIAKALEKLKYRDEWVDDVLYEDSYDEASRRISYDEYLREELEEAKTYYAEVNVLISNLKNGSESAIDQLIDWLSCEEYNVASYVAKALGEASSQFSSIIPKLLERLEDESLMLFNGIIETLGNLSNPSNEVMQFLIACLNKRNYWLICVTAAESLGKLGNSDSVIVSELLTWLELDDDAAENPYSLKSTAVRIIGKLGKKCDRVLPLLLDWIERHQDSEYVGAGIDALWKIVEG
ncbi:MAG: hypothetical protein KME13_10415 [Myxacorys californica WJT36-NPBG1]|jgi:predicted DNA-binding protein|nr:hypothetical protein [Myxacorys californica WJT36-NPBG1]